MPVSAKQQAHADAHQLQHSEKEGGAAALPGAEAACQQAVCVLRRHHRLKHTVDQKASKEVAQGNGEELEGVSRRKHPPLKR